MARRYHIPMFKTAFCLALAIMLSVMSGCADQRVSEQPPPIDAPREFRGLWVASVANIDWPSRPGLSAAQQRVELRAIFDKAADLHFNAVILQVRPAADALYESSYEPWSEYLSGQTGQSPTPAYDPLAFAVAEAHQRGLELHAWFNPFRVRHPSAQSQPSDDHVSKAHPDWTRRYGTHLWFDPGLEQAQQHSIRVVLDVVDRYDIDGVHIDDYFYPYPEKNAAGKTIDFPDEATWRGYRDAGGQFNHDDWRRDNVNRFVRRLYDAIKQRKASVRFGVSPFGVWRPGHPADVKGFDAYEKLYADARLWLDEGWCDYFSPQLYWPTHSRDQNFDSLLNWWAKQNTLGRHLWPGCYLNRVADGTTRAFSPMELVEQIQRTRVRDDVGGAVLFSAKSIMSNPGGINELLKHEAYAQPALTPSTPWLDSEAPATPTMTAAVHRGDQLRVEIKAVDTTDVRWWVVFIRRDEDWSWRIAPADQTKQAFDLDNDVGKLCELRIAALDRCGNMSLTASWCAND